MRRVGGVGNVYNVFDTTPTSQKQNVKYSINHRINEVNIVNSVQPFTDFIGMVLAVRDFGHNGRPKPSTQTLSNYYSDASLSDLTFD